MEIFLPELMMACEFASGLVHARAGLSLSQVKEIAKQSLPEYEASLADPPGGRKFQECYDGEAIEPCPEYFDLCGKVNEELTGPGLKLRS